MTENEIKMKGAEKKEIRTNFEIMPPKKVVIHNLMKLNGDEIIRFAQTPMGIMPLVWCNGYIIILNILNINTEVGSELYLKGEVHYTDLIYCSMPEYKEKIITEKDRYQDYQVINMKNSLIYVGIASLLNQIEKKV
jgi:hypothetical protein